MSREDTNPPSQVPLAREMPLLVDSETYRPIETGRVGTVRIHNRHGLKNAEILTPHQGSAAGSHLYFRPHRRRYVAVDDGELTLVSLVFRINLRGLYQRELCSGGVRQMLTPPRVVVYVLFIFQIALGGGLVTALGEVATVDVEQDEPTRSDKEPLWHTRASNVPLKGTC